MNTYEAAIKHAVGRDAAWLGRLIADSQNPA
jgi:hypothetical protein